MADLVFLNLRVGKVFLVLSRSLNIYYALKLKSFCRAQTQ